jgi:hypothetical protein
MFVYYCILLHVSVYHFVYYCILLLYNIVYDCIWLYMIVYYCILLYMIVYDCICICIFRDILRHIVHGSHNTYTNMYFIIGIYTMLINILYPSIPFPVGGFGAVTKKNEIGHIAAYFQNYESIESPYWSRTTDHHKNCWIIQSSTNQNLRTFVFHDFLMTCISPGSMAPQAG